MSNVTISQPADQSLIQSTKPQHCGRCLRTNHTDDVCFARYTIHGKLIDSPAPATRTQRFGQYNNGQVNPQNRANYNNGRQNQNRENENPGFRRRNNNGQQNRGGQNNTQPVPANNINTNAPVRSLNVPFTEQGIRYVLMECNGKIEKVRLSQDSNNTGGSASVSTIMLLTMTLAMCFIPVTSAISLTAKALPMVCDLTKPVTYYRLSDYQLSCPTISVDKEYTMKEITVSIYQKNLIQYVTTGHLCQRITTITRTYANFFGANQKLVTDYRKEPMSHSECLKMQKYKLSPDGSMSHSDGIWHTNHKPVIHYKSFTKCCIWHQTEVTNSILSPIQVYKYHFASEMEVPGSGVRHCVYAEGKCSLANGDSLTWTVNVTEKCDFVKFKTAKGYWNNQAFLSADHKIGLTFQNNGSWNPDENCVSENGHGFLSDQGLGMFLHNFSKPIINIRQTRNARRTGVVTSDQLATQSEALLLTVGELMNEMFTLHVQSACRVFADAFSAIKTNLMNDPTPVIREHINSSYVYATLIDDLVSVYRCQPVYSYQFIKSEICSSRIPLNFTLRPYSEQVLGHLDARTNIIHHEPLPVECYEGLKVLHVENNRLEYDSISGNITNITNAKELHLFHQLPAIVSTDLVLPVISEFIMYNWTVAKSHISLNSVYEAMHNQAQIMKDLSVNPVHPRSKVHHDTKTYASQITSVGLFGFLHGQTVHTNQIWVFLCCIFVTIYGGFKLIKVCLAFGSKIKTYRSRELPTGFIAALQKHDRSSTSSQHSSHHYEIDNENVIPINRCECNTSCENQTPHVNKTPTFAHLNETLNELKSHKSQDHGCDSGSGPQTPLLETQRHFYPLPDSACKKPLTPSAPTLKSNRSKFKSPDTDSESSDDYIRYKPKAKGFAYIHTNSKASNVNKAIVKVLINGQEKTALIDTGADLTILTLKAAFILGVTKFDKPEQGGKGLGGDLDMLGCATINVEVGDRKVTGFKAHVANLDLAYDLLLGTDCMEELGAFVVQVSKGKFHLGPFLPNTKTMLSPINCEVFMNKPLKVKARCHACVSVPIPLSGCDTLFLPDVMDQTMPVLLKKVVDKGDGFVSICAMNLTDSDHMIPKNYKLGTVQFISNIGEQQ